LSAVAGWVPMGSFVRLGEAEGHGINIAVALTASVMALAGIGVAWLIYAGPEDRSTQWAARFGRAYRVAKRKFLIDEVYLFVTRNILFRYVAGPIAWFDRHIVDGGVNLTAWLTRTTGAVLRYLQTGQVQTYGMWFVGGVLFVLLILWAAHP
jgi:NADH-quinone oxidoreductase subunit L